MAYQVKILRWSQAMKYVQHVQHMPSQVFMISSSPNDGRYVNILRSGLTFSAYKCFHVPLMAPCTSTAGSTEFNVCPPAATCPDERLVAVQLDLRLQLGPQPVMFGAVQTAAQQLNLLNPAHTPETDRWSTHSYREPWYLPRSKLVN